MRLFIVLLALLVLVPVATARNFTMREITQLLTTAGTEIDALQAYFSTLATILGDMTVAGTATFSDTLEVDGGPILMTATRPASAYAYALSLSGTGFFSGGAAEKTYLLNLSGSRAATDTMSGDSRDRLIGGAYSNYAPNDASSQVQGIGLNVRNRSGGLIATGKAGELGYKNDSGGTTTNAYGATVTVENYGTLSTLMCGLLIDLRNEAAVATRECGLWITNTNNSIAGTVDAAIYIDDSGANTGWDYGLDMTAATVGTAEIRGQNDETIANTTNGYWDFVGTIRGTVDAAGGATVTDFIVAVGDSITVVDGIITEIKHP